MTVGGGALFAAVVALAVGWPVYATKSRQQASDLAAIAAFNACPEVTAALGVVREVEGEQGYGESSSGGGYSEATWTIAVEGPKGAATGRYVATQFGSGPWEIRSAILQTPAGDTIVAVPCRSNAPPPTPREPGERGGRRR